MTSKTVEEKQRLTAELEAAYEKASQNAMDPAAQKAFRQKYQECRTWALEHSRHYQAD